jgi:hypothetical protein
MIVSKKIKRKETFDGLVTFFRFHPFGVVLYNLVAPAVELKTEAPGYLSRGNSAWLDSFYYIVYQQATTFVGLSFTAKFSCRIIEG